MWPFSTTKRLTTKRLTAERDEARKSAEEIATSFALWRKTASEMTRGNLALIRELQAKLEQAYFRNPKTGRLGVKGQTFD